MVNAEEEIVRADSIITLDFLGQIVYQTLGLSESKLKEYGSIQARLIQEGIVTGSNLDAFKYQVHPNRGRDLLVTGTLSKLYESANSLELELKKLKFDFTSIDSISPSNNYHFTNGERFKKEHIGFFLNYQGCSFHLLNLV